MNVFKMSYRILSLIGVGIIIYFFTKSTNKFEGELIKNGKFAIGTFKGYSFSPGTRGGNRSFQYFFYDNEEKYQNGGATFKGKYPSKNQRKTLLKDDKFLIMYNLEGSLILFDYPIKDSADFKRYVKEFEQMRKQKLTE